MGNAAAALLDCRLRTDPRENRSESAASLTSPTDSLPRKLERLGGGPPVFDDYSFGTLDDQSSSGRLVSGPATKEQPELGGTYRLSARGMKG